MTTNAPPTLITGRWQAFTLDPSSVPYARPLPVLGGDSRLGIVSGAHGHTVRVTCLLRAHVVLPTGHAWDTWTLDAMDDNDRSIWHGTALGPNLQATLHCCARCPGNHDHSQKEID